MRKLLLLLAATALSPLPAIAGPISGLPVVTPVCADKLVGTQVSTGNASNFTACSVAALAPTGIFPLGVCGGIVDDSAAINTALVTASVQGTRYVILPGGVCVVNANSIALQPGVILEGQGGSNFGFCQTTLKWTGAAAGDVVTGVVSSGTLINTGLQDVCINGNSIANRDLVLRGIQSAKFDHIALYNFLTRGVFEDVPATPTFSDQLNDWNDIIVQGNGVSSYMWEIGSSSGVYDVSNNTFTNVFLLPGSAAKGMLCGYADGNGFKNFSIYDNGAAGAPSFEAKASNATGNRGCRENTWSGTSVFQNGFQVDATGFTYPSLGNVIQSYKVGDGETYPTIQSGADASITTSTGAPAFVFTVSTLPACSAANNGAQRYVSDASSPTYHGSLTGGSTTKTWALCNVSAWVGN